MQRVKIDIQKKRKGNRKGTETEERQIAKVRYRCRAIDGELETDVIQNYDSDIEKDRDRP